MFGGPLPLKRTHLIACPVHERMKIKKAIIVSLSILEGSELENHTSLDSIERGGG
jgi:hypothetical protein